MTRTFRKALLLITLPALALAAQACRLGGRPPAGPISIPTDLRPAPTEPAVSPVAPLQSDTSTPRVVPTATLISTPTAAPVSITAVGGDLAIRTGPSPVFDAIASLKDGQSAPVYARSIQDGWVQVPLPSQPGSLGWVSTQTGFSKVDGYVLDLPLIAKVEWPTGAYLRNCTPHRVILEPGDTVVPPVGSAPDNKQWFSPGLYTAYDMDVAGRPAITQVKLWSHTSIDLLKDGTGAKYSCP